MGICGYPRASAMGLGMAITSGVSWRDLGTSGPDTATMGGWPATRRCSSRIAPHALEAGDQTVGRGPLAASSGQPWVKSCSATPDDVLWTRTKAHGLADLAADEVLKRRARSVSRSIFSGDEATSTAVQPLGTDAPDP